jgi:triacylglycerol lipase
MFTFWADALSSGHLAEPMKRLLSLTLACVFAPAVQAGEGLEGKPVATHAVLVHGIFEDGRRFKKMKARLECHGIRCLIPKLIHHDGIGGLDFLAEHLKKDIDDAFGKNEKIILIGFSMGGMVSRYYLQQLGGAERCATFITISSPHHGTASAWAFPSEGSAQMRAGSDFLADLASTEDRLEKIPVISYRTPLDVIILPPKNSIWDRAENVAFNIPIHPMMLQSSKVIDDIEGRIIQPARR